MECKQIFCAHLPARNQARGSHVVIVMVVVWVVCHVLWARPDLSAKIISCSDYDTPSWHKGELCRCLFLSKFHKNEFVQSLPCLYFISLHISTWKSLCSHFSYQYASSSKLVLKSKYFEAILENCIFITKKGMLRFVDWKNNCR